MSKLILSLAIIFVICLQSSFQKEVTEKLLKTIKGIPCVGRVFDVEMNSKLKQKLCTTNSSQLTKEQFFIIFDKNIDCISMSQENLKIKNNASLMEAKLRRECMETVFDDFEDIRASICSGPVEVEFGKSKQIEECVQANYSIVAIEQRIWQKTFTDAINRNETDTDEDMADAVCKLINCSMDIFQKAIDGKLENNFSSKLSLLYSLFIVAIYVSMTF